MGCPTCVRNVPPTFRPLMRKAASSRPCDHTANENTHVLPQRLHCDDEPRFEGWPRQCDEVESVKVAHARLLSLCVLGSLACRSMCSAVLRPK